MPLRLAMAALVAALPWLNPYAGGPSSWVAPWLFSAICGAVAFGLQAPALPHPGLGALLGALAAWPLVRSGLTPETLALAGGCLLIWMMAACADPRARGGAAVRFVATAWLVAALVSTAAALLQYFALADRFEPWVNASASHEAFANLRQRNQFASLTTIGMAAALWLAGRGLGRWPAIAAMAWLAAGNAATTSRTGLLELLLLGVATWWWTGARSERTRLWLAALAVYALAAVALPVLAQAVTGSATNPLWMRVAGSDPCGSRLVLWSNVAHLISLRPWLGWGWGELDFAHYTTLYQGPRFCDILDNAHNLPLHVAVELGLPAALVLCGVVVRAIARARPWREADDTRQLAWAVLLVLAAHSMLEYPLWYGPFQMAFGAALGLLWPAPKGPASEERVAPMVLAAAAIALAGGAVWDYWRASQIYLPSERRAAAWRHEPLARLQDDWLFRGPVRFAQLTLTPLTRDNAAWTFRTAGELLHYSPEPRVIEKLLESALLLGRDDVALAQLARFRAAFPDAYAAWSEANRGPIRR